MHGQQNIKNWLHLVWIIRTQLWW